MAKRKPFDPASALPGSPFLTRVALREDRVQPGVHPFTVPWLLPSLDLQLSRQIVAPTIPRRSIPVAVPASLRRRPVPSRRTGSRTITAAATGISASPARPDGSKNCTVRYCDPFTDAAYIPWCNDFQPRWRANPPGHAPGDGSVPNHKGFSECA
jgi:hypothetical protein